MIKRLSTHMLVRPEDVPPSQPDWEVIGTFNPGAIRFGDGVMLLIRVAERPRQYREGWTALPRWEAGVLTIDWVRDEELDVVDPRVVRRKADGLVRLTFVSHLRTAISKDGLTVDSVGPPALVPVHHSEEFGVEDPRISHLGGRYFITYVAVSRHGAATALASTTDFQTFERHGVIFCPENKDVVLFPEKIDGNYVALHRPVTGTKFANPEMWLARSTNLVHWGEHEFLYGGGQDWETGRVGAGAPPIAFSEGWLEVYHGNMRPSGSERVGAYCGGAMLLARDDPARVLKVGREPIMQPEMEFEREGFVSNVVFPMAVIEAGDRLLLYYGASDRYTAVAEIQASALMDELAHPEGMT